jgi:EpsI family protein
MTKRLMILELMLLLGMSSIFLLPASPKQQPIGVEMALPTLIGEWFGKDAAVTEKERTDLGPDTEFSRKTYSNHSGDEIFVSIVLAGQDMNTSIHRPERCLPAQGWTIADSKVVSIPLDDQNHVLKATRLHNVRPVRMQDGRQFNIYNLNYYWFVGHNDMTPSHITRTAYDIRDRLLKGYNQRWAYITVAAVITKGLKDSGRSDEEVDEIIQSFVKELVPKIHKPSVSYD